MIIKNKELNYLAVSINMSKKTLLHFSSFFGSGFNILEKNFFPIYYINF